MTDSKISDLTDGGGLAASDEFVIARSATSYRASPIGVSVLVYRYTVSGSDKTSIDTGVDTANAGSNDWTGGDLLEVWITSRTDDATAAANISVTLNNDTGSNYDRQFVRGANATASAGNSLAATSWLLQTHGSGGGASYAAVAKISIPDFTGTTFFKSGEGSIGVPDSTNTNDVTNQVILAWKSTSAVTRLAVAATAGQKLKVGSQILIYKRLAS